MSWLISQALMNSLCLQEQVEEYLAANSSDGEQSVPLNGNPIQQAFCAPDKMTDFSRLSRFGMMFKPLTEILGEELLMWYLEGFHVKTSAQQGVVQELTESDQECGEKWHASFVKFDPDSCSWKTHQCSLLGDLELFSETWPQWGLMRGGECWEQRMLEQTIRGTESGLSPDGVATFHTPNTTGLDGGSNSRKALKKRQVSWPTPVHSEARQGLQIRRQGKKGTQTSLTTAVMTWLTPRTAGMCGGTGSWELLNKNTTKEEARLMGAGNGGKLNPDWVEWLMNWPVKWSDINGFNKKEFERWTQESATPIQSFGQMRTMWWDADPSQTPFRSQPIEQSEIKHSDSLSDLSWNITRQGEMERPYQGKDLSVLRDSVYIQETERKNLQSGMWEQISVDETQIIPRISESTTGRVDRLKAIGNGQVPLCAAEAWRLLSEH